MFSFSSNTKVKIRKRPVQKLPFSNQQQEKVLFGFSFVAQELRLAFLNREQKYLKGRYKAFPKCIYVASYYNIHFSNYFIWNFWEYFKTYGFWVSHNQQSWPSESLWKNVKLSQRKVFNHSFSVFVFSCIASYCILGEPNNNYGTFIHLV